MKFLVSYKTNILRGENMSISTEDMKSCIQEWFAQAYNFEDLADIFYAVKSETDRQFVYMAEQISKNIKD